MTADLTVAPGMVALATGLRERSAGWLAQRRVAAWDAVQTLPWPDSRRDEDWRRTDISKLARADFSPVATAGSQLPALVAHGAVIVDALDAVEPLIGGAPPPAGVSVSTVEQAAERWPEEVQRALASVRVDESVFIAQWNALWQGGCFVRVDSDVEATVPVVVRSVHAAAASFPAVVVSLGANASLNLIEVRTGGAGEGVSDAVTAGHVGPGARLRYAQLQALGERYWSVGLTRFVLDRDARLDGHLAGTGAHLAKEYWEVLLEGEGSSAVVSGIAVGRGHQHLDHQSLQAHRAPHTDSRFTLHSVVDDAAVSVYSGLIDVAERAQHTDGYVKNRNLLLSRRAKADSVPRLEIRANDVRCGHGATATHVDAEELFYLRSRGLGEAAARAMIVRGFLDAALEGSDPLFADLVAKQLDEERPR